MGMESSFEKINIIHNNTSSELENVFQQSSGESISSSLGLLKNEFNGYMSIIRIFFSDKIETIKDIYEYIKSKNNTYKVDTFDLNLSMHMYKDYLNGLVDFIDGLSSMDFTNIDTSKENIINKINLMINKDNEFIDSIFGGERNQSSVVDLNCAMSNIEILTNLNNEINNLYTYTNNFIEKNNIDKSNNDVVIEGIRLFVDSIRHYIYQCVKTIFDTFSKIEISLSGNKFETVEEFFKLI